MQVTKKCNGIVTIDPLFDLPIGSEICFKTIAQVNSDAYEKPDAVKNWGYFQGAILALAFNTKGGIQILGSAFMIAPGLALTATHIISEIVDDLQGGRIAPICLGIRDKTIDVWKIGKITYNFDSDITFLSLVASSGLPEDKTYYMFGISTRTPHQGEEIQIIGFREKATAFSKNKFRFLASLYTSVGKVVEVYPYRRDNVMLPFPTIQIDCGSLGCMSGGVAIDKNGLAVGLVSTSYDHEDKSGPTFISWIIAALNIRIPLLWPSGMYPSTITLLEMDDKLVFIDKREAISNITETSYTYKIWFE